MATARPSPSAVVVHQLAGLLRANGHRVLHGDSKVCFTSDSLTLLNNYFQSAKLDTTLPMMNERPRSNSIPRLPPVQYLRINVKLRDDLVFLHDFLKKIQTVKLIHNTPTLQGNVLLYPFQHIIFLEVKKIPPHMILGLSALRHQLETLICTQSVTKIEDLIGDCGGDSAEPVAWPRLKSLFLDHNFIERVDQSLRYLPILEVLDLSHNRLQDCSKILEIIPHVKHLNLSSNQLRIVPVWSKENGPCRLITLKMRQNCLEEITGIEIMKSIEELDLSDNFITSIPVQIREMPMIKRLYFARNPFTYASNFRQEVISNLPFVFTQEHRELVIDNRPLTGKEKQMIPSRRSRPTNSASGFTLYTSGSSPPTTTTSESTTEPESLATNSTGTVVSRRRSRRRPREGRLRSLDQDETPTENATSGSENDSTAHRRRLGKLVESRQEIEDNHLSTQLSVTGTGTILEQGENGTWRSPSSPIASSIPRKLTSDLSHSPKRRKSPRTRKSDQPTKLILEVVDMSTLMSDATPVPDSPTSDRDLSMSQHHQFTPLPVLEPTNTSLQDDHLAGGTDIDRRPSFFRQSTTCSFSFSCADSIRTIFFVTDQTDMGGQPNRSLTIELDPMYLIEKDNNDSDSIEKLKYSSIKLVPADERHSKLVEFTFKRQRGEQERRLYAFDTIPDQRAFVEEIERHLEPTTPVHLELGSPTFLDCSMCGKNFPLLTTMYQTNANNSPICSACQAANVLQPTQLMAALQSKPTIDISSDKAELDHRLHFHVATEHFTHDDERIKLHFRCLAVRSTTNKHFLAQTVLTNYGIYIFHYDPDTIESNENVESVYSLVGKDLLTNVLMLDIGYQLQTFTIELQSAAFSFLLADKDKTQKIVNHILEVLSPIVQSGEGALQKISRISSDEYRQRLFQIIQTECHITETNDDMIDFYSIMIRMDPDGNSQMIALLLLRNWILIIEDAYEMIGSRHVRLPACHSSKSNPNLQLKCDLMHLVNVTNYVNQSNLFVFDFVDESETKQFRWQLESLTNESKEDFLTKVRQTYKTLMDISMPETFEML